MAIVEAHIYYPRHTSIWWNVTSFTGTNDCPDYYPPSYQSLYNCQARVNPQHYGIKFVGG